jgi:hypothetical protein
LIYYILPVSPWMVPHARRVSRFRLMMVQTTPFGRRNCVRGLSIKNCGRGGIYIKPSIFTPAVGISNVNVELNNFRTAQPISIICGSHDSALPKDFSSES